MSNIWMNNQLIITISILQVIFVIIFGIFGQYKPSAVPHTADNRTINEESGASYRQYYASFQDVHVMIFVGFGFLMTFLKRYGYSALGINMLLAAFVCQWGLIVRGVIHMLEEGHGHFQIGINELIFADFTAAVVLITMGVLLGKLSPLQYLIIGFFETIFCCINEHVVLVWLKTADAGGSMVIHVFGAYFGLAAAVLLHREEAVDHHHEEPVYHSDLFSMIGTLFLWMYWPSFNSIIADPIDSRERAIINTYLSLLACCIVTFIVTAVQDKKGQFVMDHIQNATLAGGVAIGTASNLFVTPAGAVIVGIIAGILSVCGFNYVTPFFSHKLRLHDVCGVNNLHGMPGILAGLVGVFFAFFATHSTYGQSLYVIFPAMAGEGGRSALVQALFQLAALVITFVVAIITGLITGAIVNLPIWRKVELGMLFEDGQYWRLPEDFDAFAGFAVAATSSLNKRVQSQRQMEEEAQNQYRTFPSDQPTALRQ